MTMTQPPTVPNDNVEDARDIIECARCGDTEGVRRCLEEQDANINVRDEAWGETPLAWAAEEEHPAVVKFLLSRGADVHIPDKFGRVPLHLASHQGRGDIVSELLKNGAEITRTDEDGETALHAAARCGDLCLSAIEVLVKWTEEYPGTLDIDFVDNRGWTALCYAAAHHDASKIIQHLYQHHSNPDGVDHRGRPLIIATEAGNEDTVRTLLALRKQGPRGPSLGMSDERGTLPLYWAARSGRLEIFELLIPGEDLRWPAGAVSLEPLVEAITAPSDVRSDVNIRDSDGWTPLHLAVNIGHLGAVKRLLNAGANINALNEAGRTPLILAAMKSDDGALECIEALIIGKADLNVRDIPYDQSALSYAVENTNEMTVKLLVQSGAYIYVHPGERYPAIERAASNTKATEFLRLIFEEANHDTKGPSLEVLPRTRAVEEALRYALRDELEQREIIDFIFNDWKYIYSVDEHGRDVLSWAAASGHYDVIETLLDRGSLLPTDRGDAKGRTPLSLAAESGDHKTTAQFLEYGAAVNSMDDSGRTPLSWAATPLSWVPASGSNETVKLLLDWYANPEDSDANGRTPLSWAAGGGSKQVVEILLKWHADRSDASGTTTLLQAAKGGSEEARRVNPNSRDNTGRTPLSFAAAGNSREVVILLLSWGAHRDEPDNDGRTPLSWAAGGGSEEIVGILLDWHADSSDEIGTTTLLQAAKGGSKKIGRVNPNRRDNTGRTPLSFAAAAGNSREMVILLLNRGAHRDEPDNTGRTPLSFAAECGNIDIVKDLLSWRPGNAPPLSTTASSSSRARGQGTNVARGDLRGTLSLVSVDSKDGGLNRTPLWYALMNLRVDVTRALLEHGANPFITNPSGRSHMEQFLEHSRKDSKAWKEIHKLLDRFLSLATQVPNDSELKAVEDDFTATILSFRADSSRELTPRYLSISQLLSGRSSDRGSHQDVCQWVHMPANNMVWVEVLMAKHYEAAGGGPHPRNFILQPRLWTDNQHRPRNRQQHHGRFMRPDCFVLPLVEQKKAQSGSTSKTAIDKPITDFKEKDASKRIDTSQKKAVPSHPHGVPKEDGTPKRSEADQGKTMSAPPQAPTETVKKRGELPKQARTQDSLGADVCQRGLVLFMPYLHWECEDQVRCLKDAVKRQERPPEDIWETWQSSQKLTWIYLNKPESHQIHIRRTLDQYHYHVFEDTETRDKDQTSLRYYDDEKLESPYKRLLTMVDQLWMWVLPKYGTQPPTIITAFPQRSNREKESNQTALVKKIIETCGSLSIRSCYDVADVIALECSKIYLDVTSKRHTTIQFLEVYTASIANLMERHAKRYGDFQHDIHRFNKQRQERAVASLRNAKQKSLNGKRNSKGKNSQELEPQNDPELLIRLLDVETDIEDLRLIKDIQDELEIMKSLFAAQKKVFKKMDDAVSKEFSPNKPPRNELASPTDAACGNLEEVEGLLKFAERVEPPIKELLELKQKQANLLLTTAIYDINDATDKQGKTIMTFTVVTIVFLPLSFMASFLALNIGQFPWEGEKLPLNWILKIMLSISLPLSIILLVIAFNLDRSQRKKHLNTVSWALTWLGYIQDKGTDEPRDEKADKLQAMSQRYPTEKGNEASKDKADFSRKDVDNRGQEVSVPRRQLPNTLRRLCPRKFRRAKKSDVEEGQPEDGPNDVGKNWFRGRFARTEARKVSQV